MKGFFENHLMQKPHRKVAHRRFAPVAYARLTDDLPMFQGPEVEKLLSSAFISPLAVFLASDLSARLTGEIFGIQSEKIFEYKMTTTEGLTKDRPWTVDQIADEMDIIMK